MTQNPIVVAIFSSFPEARWVRVNKTNVIAIPTDIIENGMPKYFKIAVGGFSTKATKTAEAFDYDAARADYEQWAKEAAERAAKPKKDNAASTEAAQRSAARLEALRSYIGSHEVVGMSATDLCNAVFADDKSVLPMTVGSLMNKLVDAGMVNFEVVKSKKLYTKA